MSIASPKIRLLTTEIRVEHDIVLCRQRARQFALELGFESQSQTRIATAVSEIARNAFQYANGAKVEFGVETAPHASKRPELSHQAFVISFQDKGPGIKNLDVVLSGQYQSEKGLGMGILGARRVMDKVDIETSAAGTHISLRKNLPPAARRLNTQQIQAIVDKLAQQKPANAVEEVQLQNQELLRLIEELGQRQQDVDRVNKELEETNAGVMALYDELESLHRVSMLLATKLDLTALIQALIDATTDLTAAQFGVFFMVSEPDKKWTLYTTAGPQRSKLEGLPRIYAADFFGPDFGSEQVTHVSNIGEGAPVSCVSNFVEALKDIFPVKGCLAVPVADADGILLGALIFGSSEPRLFSERSERIVASIAAPAVVAIEKARLFASVLSASEAKDKFLAMVSHELRTPLSPVLAIISNLHGDESLPQTTREDIAVVMRNVQLEIRIIDDLLDFHRLIQGKLEIDHESVDVHVMISNVLGICKDDFTAKGHHVKLDLQAAHCTVQGDAARIQQVLWNLLKNSIKFTPPGGDITVRTALEDAQTLRISVADTGRGIEPGILSSIFDAFDQGGQGVAREFGGLGLGLAITKAFVVAHHGTIVAESEGTGQGTTITVRLPLSAEDAVASSSVSPAASPKQTKERKPPQVLLVDDHADTLASLRRLLTRKGYLVTTASSCDEGVRLVLGGSFDIVISDLGLPDRSGNELIREIRETSAIPAIALSGYGMEADVVHSLSAGFNKHLTKPVHFALLQSYIESLLASVES